MKYYLSSYKLGSEIEILRSLIPPNKKTAYISNALDFADGKEWQKESTQSDISELTNLGLDVERFDLRDYFKDPSKLEKNIQKYGVIWVRGGNVFVLRQAMKLSGFDVFLQRLAKEQSNILYGGYSAGICVLSPSLKGLELVDSISYKPYGESVDIIWEGLNIINYSIAPHYHSDHPESEAVNKVVEYYKNNNISYKTLKDGEVIILE